MANVWSMAKPTRKCILAGDIIYAFDRKVSSRTFDSLGRTFDSSGECLASLRSAKQLSPSESKVRPRESKVLLSNFPSQSKWCHPLGTIIPSPTQTNCHLSLSLIHSIDCCILARTLKFPAFLNIAKRETDAFHKLFFFVTSLHSSCLLM